MPNKKISELTAAGTLTGAELIEVVQGGANVKTTVAAITGAKWRGAYDASGNTFPAAGTGSGTAGAIVAGDEYYLSVAGTLDGGLWPIGTLVKALVDTPGQTTTNWRLS
jgi:hypothetical protein